MRSLLGRELAVLWNGGRGLAFALAGLAALAFGTYVAAYISGANAAYWGFIAPAFLAFAHATALTASERESGLAARLQATPLRPVAALGARWLGATLLGGVAAAAAGSVLLALHALGLAVSAAEARYLLAALPVAAMAGALGLVAGLLLGGSGARAGAATASAGTLGLAMLPRLAAELASRLPEGSSSASAVAALGLLSPGAWADHFSTGSAWWLPGLALAGAGVFLAAVGVRLTQTPLGARRRRLPRRAGALFATGLLLAVSVAALLPVPPATAPESPEADGVEVGFGLFQAQPGPDGRLQEMPRRLEAGAPVEALLAVFLGPGQPPLHEVRISLGAATETMGAPVDVEPRTVAAAMLEHRPEAPAAVWPVTLLPRVGGLDLAFVLLAASVHAEEGSFDRMVRGPSVMKPWSSSDEVAAVCLAAGTAAALLCVPSLARARRLRRLKTRRGGAA